MVGRVGQSELLFQLVIVVAIATLGVALFERLRLPAIGGFLVMGALLGPGGLGVVSDAREIRGLAELGVVFLLFEIGLELPLDALRRFGRATLAAGAAQVGLTIAAVTAIATALGVAPSTAVVLGGLVSMSSTALVMRLLAQRREIDTPHGRLSVGILLFQDLCIVPMLIGVPILAGEVPASALPIAWVLGKAVLALGVLVIAARLFFPWLLYRVAALRSSELMSLLAFLLALGSAVAAEHMGLTLAVGAFSAGVALASSHYAHQVQAELVPLRGVLLAVFFTSVGMLFDPAVLRNEAPAVLAYVVAVLGIKAGVVIAAVSLVARQETRTAVRTGLGLAQTGEFSFVLAAAAASAGLLDDRLHEVFVAGSIVTLLATPFLVAAAPRLADLATRGADRIQRAAKRGTESRSDPVVVLVGFGLTGRTLARGLRAAGVPYAIIESNPHTIGAARNAGEPIVFGDATRPPILETARVDRARVVSIAISDPTATRRATALVRARAPHAHIVVRTRYVKEVDDLYALGASLVVAEEYEATLDMLGAVLRSLGIPGDAVERFSGELRDQGYEALRSPAAGLFDPWLGEILRETASEWVEVPDGPAAGRSIEELAIRSCTGASIVAVRRGEATIPSPLPGETLRSGDQLLVVGDAAAVERLRALFASHPGAPGAGRSSKAQV